jgi:hypothetical protein
MRLRRYLSFLTVCALLGLAGSSARAQQTVTAPDAVAPGLPTGIRLGETFVLHLSMGIEFDWDSNVFYEKDNPKNAFFMRLNPGFQLTNRPRQGTVPIQFDLHGGLSYIEYLTSNKAISNHRQFNVDAGVQAAFFTLSPYNFVVFDNYTRTTQPPYVESSENFNRDTNQVGTRINLSPGGGRLTFNVGYLFGIDYFESANLKDYDVQLHRVELRANWKFFPKTAIYLQATEQIYLYPHPGASLHPDSYALRIVAGMRGLITTKLTVDLWAGYANGFYQWSSAVMIPTVNPNTGIGGLALSWKPTLLSTGTIGYTHDFQNSLLGAYYDLDMVWLSWTQLIWRFTAFLRFEYANMRFKGVQAIQATTDGTDNYITLNLRVDYPFKNWLIGSVGNDLFVNKSDRMLTSTMPTPAIVPVDYVRDVVYLRLTFQY